MLPLRFEPTISAGEQPETYALDRAASGTSIIFLTLQTYGLDATISLYYASGKRVY
jgi:hypothetical protein